MANTMTTGEAHVSWPRKAWNGRSERGKDALGFVAVVVLGFAIGTAFVSSSPVKRFYFYQNTYAPAVMVACGRGFVQPRPEPPSMSAFLEQRSDSFDCGAIPAGIESVGPGYFQIGHRNLMLAVALWWRVLGVSWGRLATLYGLLYGLSAGFAYVLFRTVVKRWLGVGLVCVFVVSPPQLFNLPHLRDYAKAPFMLGAIGVIAWLLKGGMSRTTLVAVLAATGLVVGVGIGFRVDLVVLVPLITITILCFQPGPLLGNLASRAGGAMAFLACFAITASPTLINLGGGSNLPHLIVLGLMGEFDQRLGLNPTFYEFGYHYLDMYANTVVNAYAYLGGYAGPAIGYPSRLYDRTGAAYIVDVFVNFPADMFARYLAAIWRILHLPITAPVTFEDVYFFYDRYRPAWLMSLVHSWIWDVLLGAALWAGALLLARRSLKLLIGTIFVIAYLCGYPFLQFGVRHYFFLEVIGLWLLGLCIQGYKPTSVGKWLKPPRTVSPTHVRASVPRSFLTEALFVVKVGALVFGVPFLALWLLRVYQAGHLKTVFEAYSSLPTRPVATEPADGPHGQRALRLAEPAQQAGSGSKDVVETMYLTAAFDSRRCGRDSVSVCFNYDAADQTYAFTQCRSLKVDAQTRVVFPAYFRERLFSFAGLEMPPEEASCLTGIRRLTAEPRLHVPLMLTLPRNWKELPRYRTFR